MDELSSFQEQLQRALVMFFREKRAELGRINRSLLPIFDHGAAFTLRKDSKRIRGFLFMQGYRLLRRTVPKKILQLSMLPELLHAYLLIEDDVFDRDELRRGEKTLHIAIADAYPKWPGGANHYGMSQGMLFAGLLSIWSREIVLQSPLTPKQRLDLLGRVENMLQDTHYGEMLDILISGTERVSEREVLLVYLLKTARYTFVAPLQMGAALAGATPKQLKALEQFGVPLGEAFQRQDDYLGVFGTERQIGKSVTSDLEEKKKTPLVLHAQKHLKGKGKAAFQRLWNKSIISKRDAARIRALMVRSGAPKACRDTAENLVQKAKTALSRQRGFITHTVELLHSLADFVVHRSH